MIVKKAGEGAALIMIYEIYYALLVLIPTPGFSEFAESYSDIVFNNSLNKVRYRRN